MEISVKSKAELCLILDKVVSDKINLLESSIKDASDAMKNDTKSSAGDKFETGREMMQIEINNKQGQVNKWRQLQKDVSLISTNEQHEEIGFGTLVQTNFGIYFVSVAIGKLSFQADDFYALSLASPIGKALKGKRVGDKVSFQGKTMHITELI